MALRVRLGFAVVLSLVFAFGVGTPTAGAGTIQSPGGARVHDCVWRVTTACIPTTKGPLSAGTQVTMKCWAAGDWAAPRGVNSNRWFYSDIGGGRAGYIHAEWVSNQTQVPQCPSIDRASNGSIVGVPLWDCINDLGVRCLPGARGPVESTSYVTLRCWSKGQRVVGKYETDLWFYSTAASGFKSGNAGWIHASWVKDQLPNVRPCPSGIFVGDDYPHASAPCKHTGSVSGGCYNYDWQVAGSIYNYPWISSWGQGFGFRNCTDWVAWRLHKGGVDSKWYDYPDGRGNGKDWGDEMFKRPIPLQVPVNSHPSVGAAAVFKGGAYGHVAYVEYVHSDGTITISEYNHQGTGKFGTRIGTPASLGVDQFVHFEIFAAPSAAVWPLAGL